MSPQLSIDVGKDFSQVPAGRYPKDGDFSGQRFRDVYLAPRLKRVRSGEKLYVQIDNTEGYGSSFLEEAFGGLVRVCGFDRQFLKDHLMIESNEPSSSRYVRKIWEYIETASKK